MRDRIEFEMLVCGCGAMIDLIEEKFDPTTEEYWKAIKDGQIVLEDNFVIMYKAACSEGCGSTDWYYTPAKALHAAMGEDIVDQKGYLHG